MLQRRPSYLPSPRLNSTEDCDTQKTLTTMSVRPFAPPIGQDGVKSSRSSLVGNRQSLPKTMVGGAGDWWIHREKLFFSRPLVNSGFKKSASARTESVATW